MSLNFRIIAKFGFLLAAIGFFMPVACDMNAFQLVEHVDSTGAVLIIGLFILALAGLVIGALLLMKKNVPIFTDWFILIVSIGSGLVLLSKNELELQYGAYVIITGFIIALIVQIITQVIHSSSPSKIGDKTHNPLDIKSHLLDITSLVFTIIMLLLCIFVGNNPIKIVVFSILLVVIIIAGTFERLKEENKV